MDWRQKRTRSTRSRPYQSRRGNAAGQLIGVIGGGLMGLAIGYYLLNYLGGPSFNWLHIPLPGIPHTQGDAAKEKLNDNAAVPEPTVPDPSASTPAPPPLADAPSIPPEPARPSEPVPQFPPDYVGPRRFDLYDADDLAEALVRANTLAGGAGAGAAASGPPPALTADTYQQWCDVAEVISLLSPDAPEKSVSPRRDALRRLALRTATEGNVRVIAKQCAGVLANPPRPEAGVLLVGYVESSKPVDGLFELRLSVPNTAQKVMVLSPRGSLAARGDLALVLGSVIKEPGQNVIGYSGTEPQAVWAGLIAKVAD